MTGLTGQSPDSSGTKRAVPEEKIAALQEAIERIAAGDTEPIIDEVLEEQKAPVRRRALLLLDQRARSRHELVTRLEALEFHPQIVALVVEDLERSNLINDEDFAREWVRQRFERRGKTPTVLDQELRDKGVSGSIRAQALESITMDDQRLVAEKLAAKKAAQIKQPPASYQERQKMLARVVGVLARRGFSQSLAMDVACRALDSRLEELE